MIRRTYGSVKAELGRIAGISGMPVTDARLLNYTNLATEELSNEADWPCLVDRLRFQIYSQHFTLPARYERALFINLDDVPQPMQSPWFDFIGYGPDLIASTDNDTCDTSTSPWLCEGVLDRDDVCTYAPIPEYEDTALYYTLKVQAESIENAIAVTIMGYDQNGKWIRSSPGNVWQDGITFNLSAGTGQLATDPQVFTKITDVIKPVTNDFIDLYYTPSGLTTYTQIANWEAWETNPAYRDYYIPGLTEGTAYTVKAKCRLRYRPIAFDNDFLLISNLPALKAMIRALFYMEAKDMENYANFKLASLDLLKKEAISYRGKQRKKPLISFSGGLGMSAGGPYVL